MNGVTRSGGNSPYSYHYNTEKTTEESKPSSPYSYGTNTAASVTPRSETRNESDSGSYGSGAPTPAYLPYPRAPEVQTAPLDPVNNPADRLALAEKHAPILILPDSNDPNDLDDLPASAQEFIENSQLKEDKFGRDKIIGDNRGDKDPDFSADRLATDPENYYLDLEDSMQKTLGRPQDSDKGPAELHYEFDENNGRPMLTYHVFYANNDGPLVQNHEGDWERITIELDPETYEPLEVRMNAHEHRTDAVWDNPSEGEIEIEKVGDRPVIYVASGSHASFPRPGSYDTEVRLFEDHTPTSRADGIVYDDWGDLLDVTAQAWYPEEGKGIQWGEQGFTDATSGPYGPSPEKGFLDNPEWPEGYHEY